jgi:SAM-dependent methyltransferase
MQEATFQVHELPPRPLRLSISPAWFDFKKAGRDQMEFFTELAGLRPSDRFLDIACGVGRLAIPLSRFLNNQGSYEGFDINHSSIAFCKKNISSKYKNFNFTIASIQTPFSDIDGMTADKYTFPYADSSFDFVYAGSIFTHLLPGGARNYLNETARVLRPGGRFVATWLVYDEGAASMIPGAAGNIAKHWPHHCGGYRIKNAQCPEESVIYELLPVRSFYSNADLIVVEPLRADASYCPARIPAKRELGMHLYYALSIIAVRR